MDIPSPRPFCAIFTVHIFLLAPFVALCLGRFPAILSLSVFAVFLSVPVLCFFSAFLNPSFSIFGRSYFTLVLLFGLMRSFCHPFPDPSSLSHSKGHILINPSQINLLLSPLHSPQCGGKKCFLPQNDHGLFILAGFPPPRNSGTVRNALKVKNLKI